MGMACCGETGGAKGGNGLGLIGSMVPSHGYGFPALSSSCKLCAFSDNALYSWQARL